jgi:primosomal protein N' (replication factor Y)
VASAGPLIEVALPLPIDQTFTYAVEGTAPPLGTRVLVPFRRSERVGWVTGLGSAGGIRGIRRILAVLEPEPSVPSDLLKLARWMASYYTTPLGLVLRTSVPVALADASQDYVALVGEPPASLRPREARLVEAMGGRPHPQRVQSLRKTLGMGSLWPEIRRLGAAGVLSHVTVAPKGPSAKTRKVVVLDRWLTDLAERERVLGRARRQREAYETLEASGGAVELSHLLESGFSRSVVRGLEDRGVVVLRQEEVIRDPFLAARADPPPALVPTDHQEAALASLRGALDQDCPRPFLLRGVTGSGKTLVYIELLKTALERGQGAVVLVPEIALTPQTVSRFRAHFGDQVAVLHSALSDGERYDAWRQLRAGEKRIAVGARSAVFAPVRNLGAIVVDEEHDGSYKQSEAPRYQGRDVAIMRAAETGAVCVLGSATPSLESWANGEKGKYALLTLPERATGASLPAVEVVDLREVRRRLRVEGPGAPHQEASGGIILSSPLVSAITRRLAKEEQVILLLNRRGYANFVQCRECGAVSECPRCSVSLTYHRTTTRLLCHHCRHEEPAPQRCPRCGDRDLWYRGLGTEQVERVVAETFPRARLARMDVDTTSGKWSHQEILGRVERREVDILMGTQMIAKGLDFPNVTLVGVVNADVGMHLPDFRASERTFQLLSQVAGRAGRGPLGGEVLIQTRIPEHYAIRAAVVHDYVGFAHRELSERIDPPYPPHVRMVNVVSSSPDEELAAAAAEDAVRWTRGWLGRHALSDTVELVGPAPSPIERLHGRWRWHFFVRSPSSRTLDHVTRAFYAGFKPTGGDVRVVLDRDPVALL